MRNPVRAWCLCNIGKNPVDDTLGVFGDVLKVELGVSCVLIL